ncbi:hypothetical protein [Porphyromonas levii]|uniref:hypothetical protein n=1 Tax=Porphyromonas levii TaxID=28114 RepID=UPI001BAC8A75|nr:hypothetical protein [Porphyromonas levii]MBR8766023.1 hypothetical protein [Porphyromonas levii]MBR8773545.1 hypothetical protein [Porphyromonas levii]MBR8801773.1 hypothetical protein [Porphyromonas levii]
MKETERTITEIEVALAKNSAFHFTRNIIAYNVIGASANLRLNHECDMLILSKSGYLTEIEIKRSWSDFIADFKKKHNHKDEGGGMVKYFYYCVPTSIEEKVRKKLVELEIEYSGIITYSEDLDIKIYGSKQIHPHRRLFLEEQLELARLGAMRVILLKEKIIRNEL